MGLRLLVAFLVEWTTIFRAFFFLTVVRVPSVAAIMVFIVFRVRGVIELPGGRFSYWLIVVCCSWEYCWPFSAVLRDDNISELSLRIEGILSLPVAFFLVVVMPVRLLLFSFFF